MFCKSLRENGDLFVKFANLERIRFCVLSYAHEGAADFQFWFMFLHVFLLANWEHWTSCWTWLCMKDSTNLCKQAWTWGYSRAPNFHTHHACSTRISFTMQHMIYFLNKERADHTRFWGSTAPHTRFSPRIAKHRLI